MSGCGTFKCARRLYEGHGTSSYRPSNPEVAAENQARLAKIQAERDAQDRMWRESCQDDLQKSQTDKVSLERKMPVLPEPSIETNTYVAHPVWYRK